MHAKLFSLLALVAMAAASATAAEADYAASSHPLDRRAPIVLEPGMQPFKIPEALRGKMHLLKREDVVDKRSPYIIYRGPGEGFVRPYPSDQPIDGPPRMHPMVAADKTSASKRSLSLSPDRASA